MYPFPIFDEIIQEARESIESENGLLFWFDDREIDEDIIKECGGLQKINELTYKCNRPLYVINFVGEIDKLDNKEDALKIFEITSGAIISTIFAYIVKKYGINDEIIKLYKQYIITRIPDYDTIIVTRTLSDAFMINKFDDRSLIVPSARFVYVYMKGYGSRKMIMYGIKGASIVTLELDEESFDRIVEEDLKAMKTVKSEGLNRAQKIIEKILNTAEKII